MSTAQSTVEFTSFLLPKICIAVGYIWHITTRLAGRTWTRFHSSFKGLSFIIVL